MYLSKCCKAEVQWVLSPDFLGDDPKTMRVGTCSFLCSRCEKPCDADIDPKLYKKTRKRTT
jgi:hypothetical protein